MQLSMLETKNVNSHRSERNPYSCLSYSLRHMYVYLGSFKYTEGQPKDWVNSTLYWNMPGRPKLRGMRQGYGVLEVTRL